jgi:hypothetical protein
VSALAMGLGDVLGAVLTLLALGALAAGGYLLALLALRQEAARDPLRLAVTWLLCATAEGVVLALALGVAGVLFLPVALGLAVGIAAVLAFVLARRSGTARDPLGAPEHERIGTPGDQIAQPPRDVVSTPLRDLISMPLRGLASAVWRRVRESPVLALVAVHAAASEGVRGLLRPPLSWDSLMYHLLLAASWLQDGRVAPVFGPYPTNFYGYQPGNGSLWLWWWMAPSHGDLYVNLAFFPQCALLACGTAAVARELGARRHWPLAGFLVLLAPTVIRFAATQYVDIFLAAALVAGGWFALRWLRRPRWSDALLCGAALGLCAGTKLLGLPYAIALAAAAVVLAALPVRRRPRRAEAARLEAAERLQEPRGGDEPRAGVLGARELRPADEPGAGRRAARMGAQVGAALLLMLLCGGYFYARNAAAGAGPLAVRCESRPGPEPGALPALPRPNTVLALLGPMLRSGILARAFLGNSPPWSQELGIGPQALLLVPVVLLLPLLLPREHRRAGLLPWSQILAQLAFWVAVPYASAGQVLANVRYLIGALGFSFAAAVAAAERRVAGDWLRWIAVVLALQDLLMLHAEMTEGVRWCLAAADGAAVALALAPALRRFCRRHAPALAAAALAVALAAVPAWTRFRAADRARAFAEEFTTHRTSADRFAYAWRWLDRHAGRGTVAMVSSPYNFFVYPVMGPRLSRRAVYANVNREDFQHAADYPNCDPRTTRLRLDPGAWSDHLGRLGARWLFVSHFSPYGFPVERAWARARPERFRLRYYDANAEIFEVLPPAPGPLNAPPPGAPAGAAPPGSQAGAPAGGG